jgi:hypothetical protein
MPIRACAVTFSDGSVRGREWKRCPGTGAFCCVPALVEKKPKLKNVEPFKTVLSGNQEAMAKLPMKDLEKILAATLTGHVGGRVQRRSKEVSRERQASALGPALYRIDVSADAGSPAVSA